MEMTTTIILSDTQQIAMAAIASKVGKTVQQIVDELAEDRIMGQIRQWISDEAKTTMAGMDEAEALARLNTEPLQ